MNQIYNLLLLIIFPSLGHTTDLKDICNVPVQLHVQGDLYPNCTMSLVTIDLRNTALHNTIVEYSWYKDGEFVSNSPNITHYTNLPGTLDIRFVGLDEEGCSYEGALEMEFIVCNCSCDFTFIPEIFSPNGDGINDVFRLFYADDNCTITDYSMEIWNRSGKKVFDSRDPTESWDGVYDGSPAPSDAFIYQVDFTIGENETCERDGSFTLVR